MAGANASGICKLPLVFIHTSKKPSRFAHMEMQNLPVAYFAQKTSWTDRDIFGQWFHGSFVPKVKQFCCDSGIPPKALLLLDNAPFHPATEKLQSSDGKITAMF